MEIIIDDTPVDELAVENGTIEEALHHIQTACCPAERMVVGVRLDGKDVRSDAMAEALKKPMSTLQRLEISTGTKAELVMEAMTQASACLSDSVRACHEAAAMLTEGRTAEAAESLGKCFRVWQQVHEAISKSIAMLDMDAASCTINGEPLAGVIGKPIETLVQIKEALTVRDHVLLADVLEYEFEDVTNWWHALIARIREEAEELIENAGAS